MKILISEWKSWMKWEGCRNPILPITRIDDITAKKEVVLLPEELIKYTKYRAHIKSQTPSKRVCRRKKTE